jgi:hypothetical protein
MAHWDEERDKRRVQMMRECGWVAIENKDLIDRYEETGDDIYWAAFVDVIRHLTDEKLRNKTLSHP